MDFEHAPWTPRQRRPFIVGIGVSLAVHGLLFSLWQLAQPQRLEDDTPSPAMIVRLLRAARPEPAVTAPATDAASVTRAPAERPEPQAGGGPPATPRATPDIVPDVGPHLAPAPEALREPAVITAPPPAEADASAAAAPSARELLNRAKLAVGEIDRRLRRENPQRGIVAPVETAQMKLEKGIAQATELVPNKWYQAPKVTEIMDPGGYGRRRYRVVGARGTYCVTYESNHGPDGRDHMRDGLPPKKTTCDEDEGPATFQKWNDAPAAPPRAPFRN